ncbi:hypothetical protein AB0K12_06500 [Nonomuraea sp. NPDC049419]|uniref:hypothetical protein n=1 Tax=Nonomuraea sp. NPDC049419 TaxID=3155772 RepID=UPI0034479843
MRTRLPAALLLLLSWFLPPAAHAQAVHAQAAHAQAAHAQAAHAQAAHAQAAHAQAAHAQAVQHLAAHAAVQAAAHAAPGRAEQDHAVLRQVPQLPPVVRVWSPFWAGGAVPGGVAPPQPEQGGSGGSWAVVVPRAACGAPAGCRPPATPPRAPPSTGH